MLNILYQGVTSGWYPPLIFLGIGAMTDFSALISNPKLLLIGAAAQFGIFGAYMIALQWGLRPDAGCRHRYHRRCRRSYGHLPFLEAGSEPDGCHRRVGLFVHGIGTGYPTAHHAPADHQARTPHPHENRPRVVSHTEKVIFPIVGLLLTCFLVPSGLPLLGMLFFGNLLKESGVTRRLANTASGPLIDTITILLGLTVGASTQASEFLTFDSVKIFVLGALSFVIATASGVLFVKIFNLFLKKGNKINPLIGNAGVSAVPDSARISQIVGLEYDPTNYLLMHAMGPNVAGVIGSAIAAGILLGFLV